MSIFPMVEGRLSQLEGISWLSSATSPGVKPALLRALTELFVSNAQPTSEEKARFGELAIGLFDSVDSVTRRDIADRLATSPHVPRQLVERLAVAGGDITAGFLRQSPSLTADDLWEIAANADIPVAEALAARPDLDGPLALLLLDRGSVATALVLAGSRTVPFDRSIVAALAQSGMNRAHLGEILGERPMLATDVLMPVLPFLPNPRRRQVLDVLLLDARVPGATRAPSAPKLLLDAIESAALGGATEAITSVLADLFRVRFDAARDLVSCGETLALMLGAIGMPTEQAVRILMFASEGGKSVDGLAALTTLIEETPRSAAAWIIAEFAGTTVAPAGRHGPMLVETKTLSRGLRSQPGEPASSSEARQRLAS